MFAKTGMNTTSAIVTLSVFALIVACGGCGGAGSPGGSPVPQSPSFEVRVSPGSIDLTATSVGQSSMISIVPANGFTGSVTISSSSLPAGINAMPSFPLTIAAGSGISVMFTAGGSASTGNSNVTLTGTSGSLSAGAVLALQVQGASQSVTPVRADYIANYSNMYGTDAYRNAIVFDGQHHLIFACSPDMSRVDVLSSISHILIKSIPAPGPRTLDLSIDGATLYVGTYSSQVLAIDTVSLQITHRYLANPARIIAASSTSRAVLIGSGLNTLDLGTGTLTPKSVAALPNTYFGSMARTADGSKILLGDETSGGALAIYDPVADAFPNTVVYFGYYVRAVAANVDGSRFFAFIDNFYEQYVLVFDNALNEIQRIPVGFPIYGWVFDPTRRYLSMVVGTVTPVIFTFDTRTMTIVSESPSLATALAYYLRAPPLWVEIPMTEDDTGLVIGIGDHGIVFDDRLTNFSGIDSHSPPTSFIISEPAEGTLSGGTSVLLATNLPLTLPSYFFGNQLCMNAKFTVSYPQVTTPPGVAAGPVNVKAVSGDGSFSFMPYGFTYGLQAVHFVDHWIPASGGARIDLFGYGLGTDLTQVPTTITIGGQPATINVHTAIPPAQTGYPVPLQFLSVTAPAGSVGKSYAVINSATGTDTSANPVHYFNVADFKTSDTLNSLLLDEKRQRVYASGNNAVYAFPLVGNSAPVTINPPTLSSNKNFIGLALTPDGSRLLVTNAADGTVAVLDPDNPSNANLVALPDRTPSAPYPSPTSVATTSTGLAFVASRSAIGGCEPLLTINLASNSASYSTDPSLSCLGGIFSQTMDGNHVYISSFWSTSTNQWGPGMCSVFGVSEDLQVLAGASSISDSECNLLAPTRIPDIYEQQVYGYDAQLPASGSLAYLLEQFEVGGDLGINIFDVRHGNWRDRIELAEKIGFAPSGRQLVIDPDGRVAVVLTAVKTFDPPNGVAIIDLGKSPLSIGHLSGATGTAGALIMLRGTGFTSTSLVSVDGIPIATTFIDASTLQITMPGHASGSVGISVTDLGETYTLDDAFNYQ
jgi:hypothetical protein